MKAGRGDLDRHVPLHRHVAKDRPERPLRIGLVMIWEVYPGGDRRPMPAPATVCFGCCSGTRVRLAALRRHRPFRGAGDNGGRPPDWQRRNEEAECRHNQPLPALRLRTPNLRTSMPNGWCIIVRCGGCCRDNAGTQRYIGLSGRGRDRRPYPCNDDDGYRVFAHRCRTFTSRVAVLPETCELDQPNM